MLADEAAAREVDDASAAAARDRVLVGGVADHGGEGSAAATDGRPGEDEGVGAR